MTSGRANLPPLPVFAWDDGRVDGWVDLVSMCGSSSWHLAGFSVE